MKIENGKVTQQQITWSRNWLAKALHCSPGSVMGGRQEEPIAPMFIPKDLHPYPWFGCQNDQELGAEILKIAKGENETDLESVLDVMLNS